MPARGFRYRLHRKELPGTPELVFPKHRAVCFVHDYNWHRPHGSLNKKPPISALGPPKDNFVRFHT